MDLTKFIPQFLDRYDRVARLSPALLAISPAITFLDCRYGTSNVLFSSLLSIAAFCGGGYALTRIARDAGQRVQKTLFAQWGGMPTTQMLRHRDHRLDAHTKARCHAVIAKGLKKQFPTDADERLDPEGADALYCAGTIWLIGQTQDNARFPHVFRENLAFGFQKNMVGLRPFGLIIAIVSTGGAILACNALQFSSPYFSAAAIINAALPIKLSLSVSVAMILVWIFFFNSAAAHRTAFTYAERLILSCDQLEAPNVRPKQQRKKPPNGDSQ